MIGKALEVTVENCHHSIVLTEACWSKIWLLNCEALTLVAGVFIVPIVNVHDSREINVIAHLDAMRNPLETHGSIGVALFCIENVSPGATPE